MAEIIGGGPKSHTRGKKKAWKRPRLPIRIDMTPMVDVAFLLLIFFMVTTVFRLPQAMEINLPPEELEENTVDVKESRVLNFRVNNANQLFYNVGNEIPKLISWDSLSAKINERKNIPGIGTNLVIVGKLQPQAPFASMVNLLDQFQVDSVTRYSIGKWEAFDDSVMALAIMEK